MIKTIEFKVYTIEDHPNPEKVYEWIRYNWYDLNEHILNEVIHSLKALQDLLGGDLDYCIGQYRDRNSYIKFTGYDKSLLNNLDENKLDLTGVCWDYDIIKGLKDGRIENILEVIEQDTVSQYSDEGLFDLCTNNEYLFTSQGSIYNI